MSSFEYEKLVEVWGISSYTPAGPVLLFIMEEWIPLEIARKGYDSKKKMIFKPLPPERVQELLEDHVNIIRRRD